MYGPKVLQKERVRRAKELWDAMLVSLVVAVDKSRAGNKSGAQANLNNALVFAARYTMFSDQDAPNDGQTVVSELSEHAVGPATREHVEFIVAHVAAMAHCKEDLEIAFKNEGIHSIDGDADDLMDLYNASRDIQRT